MIVDYKVLNLVVRDLVFYSIYIVVYKICVYLIKCTREYLCFIYLQFSPYKVVSVITSLFLWTRFSAVIFGYLCVVEFAYKGIISLYGVVALNVCACYNSVLVNVNNSIWIRYCFDNITPNKWNGWSLNDELFRICISTSG